MKYIMHPDYWEDVKKDMTEQERARLNDFPDTWNGSEVFLSESYPRYQEPFPLTNKALLDMLGMKINE